MLRLKETAFAGMLVLVAGAVSCYLAPPYNQWVRSYYWESHHMSPESVVAIPGGEFVVSGIAIPPDFNEARSRAVFARIRRDLSTNWAISVPRSKPPVSGVSLQRYSVWLFEEEDEFSIFWLDHNGDIVRQAVLGIETSQELLNSLNPIIRREYGIRGEVVGVEALGRSARIAVHEDGSAMIASPIGIEFTRSSSRSSSGGPSKIGSVCGILLLRVSPEKNATGEIVLLPKTFSGRPSGPLPFLTAPVNGGFGLGLVGLHYSEQMEAAWIGEVDLGFEPRPKRFARIAALTALARKGYLVEGILRGAEGDYSVLLTRSKPPDPARPWLSCSSECIAIAQLEWVARGSSFLTVAYLRGTQRLGLAPTILSRSPMDGPPAGWFAPLLDTLTEELSSMLLPAQKPRNDSMYVVRVREPEGGSLISAVWAGTELFLVGSTIFPTKVQVLLERVPMETEQIEVVWREVPASGVNVTPHIETTWAREASERVTLIEMGTATLRHVVGPPIESLYIVRVTLGTFPETSLPVK